jgi:D-alanyl-D-alanine carboxypeptidase/D-alanyl-D-alanine-endopeptidase (penicillin-binding protein 4)
MFRRVVPAFLLLFAIVQPALAKHDPLAAQIETILAQPDVGRGFWGIEVVSLKDGHTLYALNSDKLFTPASNTKLFTTAAVLALIGPDYKFKTTVETAGAVDKYGRLVGDLVLVGRGDPNLSGRVLPYGGRTQRTQPSIRVLEQLADQLVQKGVKYIDGDIVADDSYYAFERYGEGWTQDDLVWESGAPVSALSINDNVMFVNILPADRPGEKAFVSIDPFADYYHIDNRILTTPSGTGPRKIFINREPGSNLLTLWGNIPVDDPGAGEALAIDDPAAFAGQLFERLLEQRGIAVYGKSRTRHTELASLQTLSVTALASGGGEHASSRQPLVLASYESSPLIDDLQVINKVSQNLHAELMLRLLGREKGTSGTIEGGLEVERGFLAQAGISPGQYVFYDGSGMSRENLVTPQAVVQLLRYAAGQPWGKAWQDTLAIAGIDGSLANRFKGTTAEGRVRAKDGALGHVNTLSGYATTVNGVPIAFSILINNHKLASKRALEVVDQIVLAIVNDQPAGKKQN